MSTPEFVVALRAKIGTAPLTLPGTTAVVFDGDDRVLLVRRSDNGRWTLVTGCLEPGEQPAVGAVREIVEETGVEAVVERMLAVEAIDKRVLPNGDEVFWLDVAFRCRAVGGLARVNDDESMAVEWFDLHDRPELPERQERCLALAVNSDKSVWFGR